MLSLLSYKKLKALKRVKRNMREKEDKCIWILALSLSCHGVFSPFPSSSYAYLVIFLNNSNYECLLHFSLGILKNESLRFFCMAGRTKRDTTIFSPHNNQTKFAILMFQYLKSVEKAIAPVFVYCSDDVFTMATMATR